MEAGLEPRTAPWPELLQPQADLHSALLPRPRPQEVSGAAGSAHTPLRPAPPDAGEV